jgi:2'-5' RNA ligase
MAKIRTFIAVEASQAIKSQAALLVDRLAQTRAHVKWVAEEQMHWTLKFLGQVESNEVPRLCQTVAARVEGFRAFEILASGAGAFPNSQRPRTLWLGVEQGSDAFVCLHQRVEESLLDLGFRREHRRFRPHLTIGRVRRSPQGIAELAEAVAGQADFLAGPMPVPELVLFASRLRRTGPQYQPLCRIPLGR